MDPALTLVVDPMGTRRFFPPGAHPAFARHRRMAAQLDRLPQSPMRDEALAYHRNFLANAEEGESLAKHDWLRRLRPM